MNTNDGELGELHWLRAIAKTLYHLDEMSGQIAMAQTRTNDLLASIAASVASLDGKTPAPPAITADGEIIETSQKG